MFCHNNVVKYRLLRLSFSSERVMRLDYQILLKSPTLKLLAGSTPVCNDTGTCGCKL